MLKGARNMRLICLALIISSLVPFAGRADARVLPGPSVRVAIEGHREPGIGLHGSGRGWRLPLGAAEATSVVLVDVTAPTRDKWVVPVGGRAVVLEGARFVGGHAYRVEVMRGMTIVDHALVYLYPTRGGRTTKVEFDVDGDGAGDGAASDEIRLTPKSAL